MKYKLDYVEFYVTNVCNLNCHNCNRYNNFPFSGHYHWDDYWDEYNRWSKIIDTNHICILGGEPFANPEILHWLHGIAALWTDSKISIVTNGYYFDRWPTLYQELLQYQGRCSIQVSNHHWSNIRDDLEKIRTWFPSSVKTTLLYDNKIWYKRYQAARFADWPSCETVESFFSSSESFQEICYQQGCHPTQIFTTKFEDDNQIIVDFVPQFYFQPIALNYHPGTDKIRLNHSSPSKAVDICISKKCHTFLHGKLYKCPTMAILPEFLDQFDIDADQKDVALLQKYVPASVDWTKDQMKKFIEDCISGKEIDQCTFCPESDKVGMPLESGSKKIKLSKKLTKTSTFDLEKLNESV